MPVAERRQLTVVFIDIADSTSLSERLDPEDFFSILRTYRDLCDHWIKRYGGNIARTVGDGLLAYFGLPHAQQGDPEHAVHAALAICNAIREHEFFTPELGPIRLSVRIAVNTGIVVVGSLTGDEGIERRDVFGTSAHIAAKLQSLAPPNGVIVGPSTHKLVHGAFRCSQLGKQAIKGVKDPLTVWRVDGVALAESRFETMRTAPLTPMIGREPEIAKLIELWGRAVAGQGSVVVVSGEPGIGKSRLIKALRLALVGCKKEVLHFQCSSLHVSTPLAPVIERDRRQARLKADDTPEEMIDKLRVLIEMAMDDSDAAIRYYGALHAIPACNDYTPANLSDPNERDRALAIAANAVTSLSRRRPVLVIVEDVQWIDPTSVDLLERLMAAIDHERVLLIITHRSRQDPYWLVDRSVINMSLPKLDDRECVAMVQTLAGDGSVPASVLRSIVDRSDGIPLFVEECTRAVLEAPLQHNGNGRKASARLKEPFIPASLQDLLMERLDRLGDAKWIAQVASIFGRQFDYASLRHLVVIPKRELAVALRRIEEAGLFHRQRRSPGTIFTFKHAMIQEAAYGSLLKEVRAGLHARAADALRSADAGKRHPAVLAHHFARAGMVREAVDAWLESGKEALARSANREAIANLWQGIELTPRLPDTEARFQTELVLQAHLAVAYTAMVGWAGAEVDRPMARGLELCRSYGSAREKAIVLWGATIAAVVGSQLKKALDLSNEFIELASAWGDEEALLLANTTCVLANFFLGRLPEARQAARLVCARYDRRVHGGLVYKCLHDPKVVALVYLGHIEWLLGNPQGCKEASTSARALARELGHPFMLAFALILGSSDHLYEGDHAANLACVEEGMRLAEEHGISLYGSFGPLWSVPAMVARDRSSLEHLSRVLATLLDNHFYLQAPLYATFLAAEFGRTGQVERGRRLAAMAQTLMQRTGEIWFQAEIHRVRGVLMSLEPDPDPDAARYEFETALLSAKRLGALGWQLRTTVSYARFLRSQDQPAKARALLIETTRRFSPAVACADLREAETLLRALDANRVRAGRAETG